MDTYTPRPPLPRWVWIVIGLIAAVAVVLGVLLFAQRNQDTNAEPTSAPTAAPAPTSEATEVTGCLAPGQDINMLLATQKGAPHTANGAAEFAAAQLRWQKRWPWPSAAEYQTAIERTWSDAPPFDQAAYDSLVSGPNLSSGIVPEGTPFHTTAGIGRWFVDSYDGDTAQVTVGLSYVIGDAVSPLYRSVGTYTLRWTDAGWTVATLENKYTVQEAFDRGTPFTGGC